MTKPAAFKLRKGVGGWRRESRKDEAKNRCGEDEERMKVTITLQSIFVIAATQYSHKTDDQGEDNCWKNHGAWCVYLASSTSLSEAH